MSPLKAQVLSWILPPLLHSLRVERTCTAMATSQRLPAGLLCWIVLCLVLAAPGWALAAELPLIEDVEWGTFRKQCLTLLAGQERFAALPPRTVQAVRALLVETPDDPGSASLAVQKLLDPHCLVGVNINPESRVKAARGQRKADLTRDRPIFVLVKIHNQGGVTHPLAVQSEQAIGPGDKNPDQWLQLGMVNEKPFASELTGRLVEYRVLRLLARQTGKREASLAFDVGQGTQDLGFRAEVPILFQVQPR